MSHGRTSQQLKYFTLTELAAACGASVHAARNYKAAGLIRGCARTPGGYALFDRGALQRLRLVRLLREASVTVCDIKRLVAALDGDGRQFDGEIERIGLRIVAQRQALSSLEMQLATLTCGTPARDGRLTGGR